MGSTADISQFIFLQTFFSNHKANKFFFFPLKPFFFLVIYALIQQRPKEVAVFTNTQETVPVLTQKHSENDGERN